jgi:hypothetical protein
VKCWKSDGFWRIRQDTLRYRYKAPVAHTLCILVWHIVSLLYDVTICYRFTRKGPQHLSAKSLDSGLSRSVHPTEKTCSLLSLCPMGLVEESSGQLQVTCLTNSAVFHQQRKLSCSWSPNHRSWRLASSPCFQNARDLWDFSHVSSCLIISRHVLPCYVICHGKRVKSTHMISVCFNVLYPVAVSTPMLRCRALWEMQCM